MKLKGHCIESTINSTGRLVVTLDSSQATIIVQLKSNPFDVDSKKFRKLFGCYPKSTAHYGMYKKLEGKVLTVVDWQIVDIDPKVSTVRVAFRWALIVAILGVIGAIVNMILFMLM